MMDDANGAVGGKAGLPKEEWLEAGAVCRGVGNVVRWAVLRELVGGEVLLVRDIARRLGKVENTVSKHLLQLLRLGLVERNRAGVYSIPERFVVSREEGVVDFGRCVVRLRAGGG